MTRLGIVGRTGTRGVESERRYASLAAVLLLLVLCLLLLLLPLLCLLLLLQLLLLVDARQLSGTVPIVCVANLYMNIETGAQEAN